jgi:hypothetical protein
VADELRRQAIAAAAGPAGTTALRVAADTSATMLDTATCLGDVLPGSGDFPRSDRREIGPVRLPALLPFLFDDRAPPAATTLTTTPTGSTVALDWPDGAEADLAGYHVYRLTDPAAAPAQLTPTPITASAYTDQAVPAGTAPTYLIRSIDTSGNLSEPSLAQPAPVAPPAPS